MHFVLRSFRFLVGSGLAFVGAACGTGGGAPQSVASGASAGDASVETECDARRDGAKKQIEEVINANLQCSSDQDCVSVPFASKCFDACARAVTLTGEPSVRDAIARIDETTCANYEKDGCRLIRPPCIPPTAICKHGICK